MAKQRVLLVNKQTLDRFTDWCRATSEADGYEFRSNAFRHAGKWAIPLADDVADRLEQLRSPGQTDEDLVYTLMETSLQKQ